ncbi:MAG TPA: SOS response-associated peptidase [Pirellulaceae bacterium]|nr:SOS response-associated peptidase [Pirellulaceae bacterium]
MCGRFNLRTPMTVLAEQFVFDLGPLAGEAFPPRYNIAPTQKVAAVRLVDRKRQLAMLHWGLVPNWAKDLKMGINTINARADSVADRPVYRAAYEKRRCLVLADGYYEWEKVGKAKLPWMYEVDGGKPFAFAGLWECWQGDKPYAWESCATITTDANELATYVHTRMPVILDPAHYDAWLAGEQIPLVPFPADRMTAKPVSTFLNNARNEGPECIEPREELK